MDRVDVYVSTDIKGIRKADGQIIWLLEMQSQKGPVTRCDRETVTNETARIAELTALTRALSRMTKPCEIMLHITNQNLAKTFDKNWIDTWAETDFMDCKGEPMKDVDKWREFYKLYKQHKLLGVSCETNSYSSWMRNELGLKNDDVAQSRINGSYDTILKIQEMVESLDLSDAAESEEMTNAINTLCETFFKKFTITQNLTTSGFVRIEKAKSRKSGS